MREKRLYNLERIRKEKGLSRRELELLSGVKMLTIHNLERGMVSFEKIHLGTLIALAKALKVKVVNLVPSDIEHYLH